MTETPHLSGSNGKKAYHTPDLREFGTVQELTLTGSAGGNSVDYAQQEYTTGDSDYAG